MKKQLFDARSKLHARKMAKIGQRPIRQKQKLDYKLKKIEAKHAAKVNRAKAVQKWKTASTLGRAAAVPTTAALSPIAGSFESTWGDAITAPGKTESQRDTLGGDTNSLYKEDRS